MSLALDSLLALLLVTLALRTVLAGAELSAIIGFISLGLVTALAWVKLGSIDVALTEAAIGSGATGFLLLTTEAALRRSRFVTAPRIDTPESDLAPQGEDPGSPAAGPALAAITAGAVAVTVAVALLTLPEPAPSLSAPVVAALPTVGVGNPVTGVLLAFRSLDTLLEKVVLLLALVGIWVIAARPARVADTVAVPAPPGPLLLLARVLPPVGTLVGLYLLWEGADAPGGAFQGGAVLASMWILAMLAGLAPLPRRDDRRLRLVVVAGAGLFLAVGFAGVPLAGHFLAFPATVAKPLIVAVEAAITLSVAATLALLVAGQMRRPGA